MKLERLNKEDGGKGQGQYWQSVDDYASETETQDFLYGLVRIMKPEIVIETGCYSGLATRKMIDALVANNFGHLYGCDIDVDRWHELCARLMRRLKEGEESRWTLTSCTGEEMIRGMREKSIGVAFLDSGGNRLNEVIELGSKMEKYGIVVIHDARRPLEREAAKYARDALGWNECWINTPRGIVMLQVK